MLEVHRGAGGLDARALVRRQNRIRAQALGDSVQERVLKIGAVERELRPPVPRIAPKRLAVDELSETVEENSLLREHAEPRELGLEPQLAQDVRCVRKDVDACAKGTP